MHTVAILKGLGFLRKARLAQLANFVKLVMERGSL